jgi:hypothetical protein
MHVANVCSKYFTCFRPMLHLNIAYVTMLHMFQTYVASSIQNVSSISNVRCKYVYLDVVVAIHICCKHMFIIVSPISDVCCRSAFMLQH